MTKEQLLSRKTIISKQIKTYEQRILVNKDRVKEQIMFDRLAILREQLRKIEKALNQLL